MVLSRMVVITSYPPPWQGSQGLLVAWIRNSYYFFNILRLCSRELLHRRLWDAEVHIGFVGSSFGMVTQVLPYSRFEFVTSRRMDVNVRKAVHLVNVS
jgi:hypothetical protein